MSHLDARTSIGWRGTLVTFLVLALTAALLVAAAPNAEAHPGHCKLEGWQRQINPHNAPEGRYWLAGTVNKHNGKCRDLNIRYVDHTSWFRGAYRTQSGNWYWGSVGRVKIVNPASQNFVMVSGVLDGTPIRAGSTEQDHWYSARKNRYNH